MFGFSPIQMVIVLAIVLLVFGAKRLPEMGRSLGQGLRGFKDSLSGDSSGPDAAEALGRAAAVEHEVALRQQPPAPTPEIARAEAAERLVDAR